MSAQHLLDRAYSPAAIEALAAEPERYSHALAEELPVEFEAAEPVLADALAQIDTATARAMRVALEHADTGLAAPTRNVFATTIVAYAANLELLGQRAYDAASRGRVGDPATIAQTVVALGRAALALREGLRAGVLALIAARAGAAIADADRSARDRKLDDAARRQWSAVRRDLEGVVARPASIADAPRAKRLAALPDQLDEPDPVAEPTFADMIELD